MPLRRHENGRDACEVTRAVALRVLLPALQIRGARCERVVVAPARAQCEGLEREPVREAFVMVGRFCIGQDHARVGSRRVDIAASQHDAPTHTPRKGSVQQFLAVHVGRAQPQRRLPVAPVICTLRLHQLDPADRVGLACARRPLGCDALGRGGPLEIAKPGEVLGHVRMLDRSARVAVLGEDPAALAHVLDPTEVTEIDACPAPPAEQQRARLDVLVDPEHLRQEVEPLLRATRNEQSIRASSSDQPADGTLRHARRVGCRTSVVRIRALAVTEPVHRPLREYLLHPGRALPVPGGDLRVDRRLEQLLVGRPCVRSGERVVVQQPWPLRIIRGGQSERELVMPGSGRVRRQRLGLAAGLDQRSTRAG